MAKVTLNDIQSGYLTTSTYNANNTAIEAGFENTLSRDGTSPNQMEANLDMNGNYILNSGNAVQVDGFTWEGPWITAQAYTIGDIVEYDGSAYFCIVNHTSGVFATDLAAVKWQLFATASLPSQTGNSGEYLTTNGSSLDWATPSATQLSYTNPSTGGASRTLSNKFSTDVISVKDFGATGDGVTDDTSAVQAAVTAMMLNGTSLYIPSGTYVLTAAITGSGTKSISLVGDGPSLTQLIWTATSSGIQLTFDDSFTAGDSVVTGVGFYADIAACVGPALQLTATTNSTLTPTFGPVITNNVIQYTKGTSATGRYWNAGIVIENFHAGLIQANFIYGRANNPAGNGLIFNGNCTPGPTISDNHFYWWNKAVTKGNTASDTVEGGYATNNILVANNYGFYWDCSGIGGDPDFKVLGGHISSLLGGVVCIDANQSWISNVLFYRRSDATGDYADITYTDSVSVHISGNTFVNSGTSGTETGIDLNNVDAILCHDNFFQGSSRDVGINIDANCSRVSVYDNQYYSTTTPVINALTDLTLYNLKSINAPGYASVRLTTQSIPTSGVAAVLEWAPVTLLATLDGAFDAGDPTKMVVPADITKVRVSCSILFASNATGYRQVRILKNGTDFHGFTTDRAIALTSVGTSISSTTGLLTVTPGDYFTIEVTQTSGGALDVSSSNGTWFAMEFIG